MTVDESSPGPAGAHDEPGFALTDWPSTAELIELYSRMYRIRRFEELIADLYRDGEVPGFVHLSIGQEASAVGACWPLRPEDIITSTHRGHGHCLAKGMPPGPMFAELMAREQGVNKGRAGSMHIADPGLGIFGANGIVGAGLPIALGAAVAFRVRSEHRVAVAFFGDGAAAQGAFHEAVNLAALWKLPLVFVCENNHYAEFSAAQDQHPVDLSTRAVGYGVPFVRVDGNDVVAVAREMRDVVARLRHGAGPVIIEADTFRHHGHYEGDPERYRSSEEVERWRIERDPLQSCRAALARAGVGDATVVEVEQHIDEQLRDAVNTARAAPEPSPDTMHDFVLAARTNRTIPHRSANDLEDCRMSEAVRLAMHDALEDDPAVFLAGVDVGKGGNVFGLTRGLKDRWPERVRDTPISETAVIGLAVGSAMAGMRPIVELMYLDFLGVCFDQILNQAAKLHYMTGGKANLSLTIRTQFGAGKSSGSQHSQSLEALLAHIPGLTVVMPSTPLDAYGLLRSAIEDPNPVIVIEHRHLYGVKGLRPARDHRTPIGIAHIARPGRDVTVVSVSRMVHEALKAAEQLASEGIEAEVIDVRTVTPLDRTTILESLSRTSRLLIAHEAVTDFGIGAEIAALAASEGFWYLDAPVTRVGAPFTPPPYAPALEREWLPDHNLIAQAIRDLRRI
jgi:2-oxoisovalerate dehydrogenase E1 component